MRQAVEEVLHHDGGAFGEVGFVAVGVAAGGSDEVRDAAEDGGRATVAGGDPGDGGGLPVDGDGVVLGDEVGDVGHDKVAIGGEHGGADELGEGVSPRGIEFGGVMAEGGGGVAHLFEDVVGDGAGGDDGSEAGDAAADAAAGSEVEDEAGLEFADRPFGGGGGRDFAPAAVGDDGVLGMEAGAKEFAVGSGLITFAGEELADLAPFGVGGDEAQKGAGGGGEGGGAPKESEEGTAAQLPG